MLVIVSVVIKKGKGKFGVVGIFWFFYSFVDSDGMFGGVVLWYLFLDLVDG